MEPAIRADGLRKSYGDVQALDGLSFERLHVAVGLPEAVGADRGFHIERRRSARLRLLNPTKAWYRPAREYELRTGPHTVPTDISARDTLSAVTLPVLQGC